MSQKKNKLKERLATMTPEEKQRLYDLLQEKKARVKARRPAYSPNSGQRRVHASEKWLRGVFAGNGCWAPGTKVRLHNGGTVAVEDVAVGDILLGPDGGPRRVLETHQGVDNMYEVAPADKSGAPYVCNSKHLLVFESCTTDPRYGWTKGQQITLTPEQYLALPNRQRRLLYGVRTTAVQYPEQPVVLDPYILGIWLGDGTSSAPALTNEDPVIIDAMYEYCGQAVFAADAGRAATFRYAALRPKLKFYNLLKNKHIPEVFLRGSIRQRLCLLAGLLDTDGHLANNGAYYEFVQKNPTLSTQVIELARSLGFRATMRQKLINGVPYNRINITGAVHRIPCRVPHKMTKYYRRQRDPRRYRPTVRQVGSGQYFGFSVDGDNLIVLEDYTVNHNSGKSALAANEAIWAMQGYNPVTKKFSKVPTRVIVVLDDPSKANDQWVPELMKWYSFREDQLHKRGKPSYSQVTMDNGSELIFMSHNQEPLLFESIEADVVIFDEPPPRHIYVALVRGLRKAGRTPWVLIVGTPIAASWMRTEILEPWERGERKDIECFTYGTEVNTQNLAEGYIERMRATLTEKEVRIRLFGEFYDLDGLALAHLFNERTHVVDLPPSWNPDNPCVIAMDPHPSKAHFAVLLGCDEHNNLYYLDEYKQKAPARPFTEALIERGWFTDHKIIDIVYDSLGSADTTSGEGYRSFGEVVNEVLADRGLGRARATTYTDKSDENFIERIRDSLLIPDDGTPPKLRIVRGNIGIIQDIRNVQWAQYAKNRNIDESKPKLDITQKDYLSCLKYALATNLYFKKVGDSRGFRPTQGPSTYGAARKPRILNRIQLRARRRH
jgi:hypothetical protein